MKICTKCGIEKNESEFHKQKSHKNGLCSWCKACVNNNHQKWYNKNKIRLQDYQREYQKEYYKDNHEKAKEAVKRWRTDNPDYKQEYYKNRRKVDPNYKLAMNLRSRIRSAVKSQFGDKAYKSIELLGCTIEEARQHLESKFQDGMTWENYGMFGWHIDHIKPVSSFDLTNPEEQKKCFHYTNLQPLWAEENLTKGARL
jgi:hypothetical protein